MKKTLNQTVTRERKNITEHFSNELEVITHENCTKLPKFVHFILTICKKVTQNIFTDLTLLSAFRDDPV